MGKQEERINSFIKQTVASMNIILMDAYNQGWIEGAKGTRVPGVQMCKNVKCTTVYFIPPRPNQTYCSERCRNYHNVNLRRKILKNGGNNARA